MAEVELARRRVESPKRRSRSNFLPRQQPKLYHGVPIAEFAPPNDTGLAALCPISLLRRRLAEDSARLAPGGLRGRHTDAGRLNSGFPLALCFAESTSGAALRVL